MKADIVPGRLLTINGKYADFEPKTEDEGDGKIVMKYSQSTKSNLSVYMKSKGKETYLGFCFAQKEKSYVLGVEGEKFCFKIQAKQQSENFSDKFLFKLDAEKGSYGSLKSMGECSRYLSVHDKEVTLSSTPVNLFKVSLEPENIQSRMLSMPNSGVKFWHTRHTRMQCRGLYKCTTAAKNQSQAPWSVAKALIRPA
ncbi:hypothetical protein Q7C36_010286 [Tachysurus vachellii]|uniref:Uncharacterized protein n=1 Tax=Tachysurus vachellii TaxID=175792 RepID=A0AA88SPU9_TACVA|nr:hypothetical protein Q7C36_010286 [Tachysurus vachellii]